MRNLHDLLLVLVQEPILFGLATFGLLRLDSDGENKNVTCRRSPGDFWIACFAGFAYGTIAMCCYVRSK